MKQGKWGTTSMRRCLARFGRWPADGGPACCCWPAAVDLSNRCSPAACPCDVADAGCPCPVDLPVLDAASRPKSQRRRAGSPDLPAHMVSRRQPMC
uniref:Uncharacterized protein n=1 Tax=Aegilops tauschii subsp. strangulata TaxID=200361 RepID=A0A453S171_AEGTS